MDYRFRDYYQMIDLLNSDPSIHFILRESDLKKAMDDPNTGDVNLALKKALLYAQRAIVLTRTLEAYSGWGTDNLPTIPVVIPPLENVLKLKDKIPEFDNIFYFIPEKVSDQIIDDDSSDAEFDERLPPTVADFFETYKNRLGINVSFTDPAIYSHLFETKRSNSKMSVLNVWQPQLSNVPLETLLKIRKDESDSFTRYQHVLRKLIIDENELDSETKIKELFQYVDYETRVLASKMQVITKSQTLKKLGAAVGVSIMGLSFAMPTEIASIVASVVGTYTGKEFFSNLFQEREKINDLKSSDFYVPWLCLAKSK